MTRVAGATYLESEGGEASREPPERSPRDREVQRESGAEQREGEKRPKE